MARVKVDITGDASGFHSAMKSVKHSVEDIKTMIAGAFTAEAIGSLIEKTFDYADTIDKASLRMKITTEQTQALGIVAREAGTSLETIEGAFRKIEAARAKALGGDVRTRNLFKALGVSTADLSKSGNTIGLAGQVASAASHGSTDKEGVALQGLGLKSASSDLLALGDSLSNLDEEIQKLKAEGAIIPDEDIANMIRAKDEMEIVSNMLMAHVAPVISWLIEAVERYYVIFKAYWSNIFTAIVTMASDTLNYLIHLPKALAGTLTGNKKDNLSTNTEKFTSRIGEDLKDTIGSIGDEIKTGMSEYNTSLEAQLAKRAAQRKQSDTGVVAPISPAKTKKGGLSDYSDSLTSVGNMLGASFNNIGQVTSQLDVAKNQLKVTQDQTTILKSIDETLASFEENNNGGTDMSTLFN